MLCLGLLSTDSGPRHQNTTKQTSCLKTLRGPVKSLRAAKATQTQPIVAGDIALCMAMRKPIAFQKGPGQHSLIIAILQTIESTTRMTR